MLLRKRQGWNNTDVNLKLSSSTLLPTLKDSFGYSFYWAKPIWSSKLKCLSRDLSLKVSWLCNILSGAVKFLVSLIWVRMFTTLKRGQFCFSPNLTWRLCNSRASEGLFGYGCLVYLDDNISVESSLIAASQNPWEFIGCFTVSVSG